MSDLVSREALIEAMNKRVNNGAVQGWLASIINGQPAACDVDKVVGRLKDTEETIRRLLCSEYGSPCQFCLHDDNPDAECFKAGGSGAWCGENAAWKGGRADET